MQGLHPRTQQKSRRLKEEPHMHRQRKHRTYGVSAVCRKSAGIEKYTGSDSARSIRILNVEEAALTEQLGETEPGKSALSFHRTGGETLDEAPLQKHEDHRDRDGRDDGGRHHVSPSSSTPRRGTSSQERRPASSNRAGRSRTVPALCAETWKISVRGSLKCWSEIQFDKKKILYQAARPVMVELAGLKAFYGRFLDKNGVCW